ncbi:hypothetical protein ACTNEN_09510 [Oribacterium sp. HCP28S3_H8]|jgi:hypothetical protein|uniref:hypothetical protein n=1 Tax=Oribacterium sp. HCP28S3_H8 TaxID=3438945 RepID=UPI003F8A7503
MAAYLAMRIEGGHLNYTKVISKYPQYKDAIDEILLLDGYTVNSDGTIKKG